VTPAAGDRGPGTHPRRVSVPVPGWRAIRPTAPWQVPVWSIVSDNSRPTRSRRSGG